MKQTNRSVMGTHFHDLVVKATVNELKKILGNPLPSHLVDPFKVNYEWEMETSKGAVFTVYDYKLGRKPHDNETVSWHIGAHSPYKAKDAIEEIEAALAGIRETLPKEVKTFGDVTDGGTIYVVEQSQHHVEAVYVSIEYDEGLKYTGLNFRVDDWWEFSLDLSEVAKWNHVSTVSHDYGEGGQTSADIFTTHDEAIQFLAEKIQSTISELQEQAAYIKETYGY